MNRQINEREIAHDKHSPYDWNSTPTDRKAPRMPDKRLTDEEFAEAQRRDEEYRARLVPASNDEIINVAATLWTDPGLRAIFERVGCDADMSASEEAAIEEALATSRQGPLWDRDDLHLALAPCLLRQLAGGAISEIDGPEACAFIQDRKVERIGTGMRPKNPTVDEVLAFAQAMRADAEIWTLCLRVKNEITLTDEEVALLRRFEAKYIRKFCLFNRSGAGLSAAHLLLRSVAAGSITAVDSVEARELLKSSHFIEG